MRIISGALKGLKFPVYRGDNTRPTSDLAKQGIFNTLEQIMEFEGLEVIDLFAGTGNMGLEFLSRGAARLDSVDHDVRNIRYMQDMQKTLKLPLWHIHKSDAEQFVRKPGIRSDLVFADPPYDYARIHNLVQTVLDLDWFRERNSILVLEHVDRLVFNQKGLFLKKQYGDTSFSCFRTIKNT